MQGLLIMKFHTEISQLIVTHLIFPPVEDCYFLQLAAEGWAVNTMTTRGWYSLCFYHNVLLARGDGCISPETAYLTFWCLSPSAVLVLLNDFAQSNKRRCDSLQ